MVDESIITKVRSYLSTLPGYGIHPRRAVLFGSFARGDAREWSDIDVVVVAPEFDESRSVEIVEKLWVATRHTDSRIEPIACGEFEWDHDESRPILGIARREGIVIAA